MCKFIKELSTQSAVKPIAEWYKAEKSHHRGKYHCIQPKRVEQSKRSKLKEEETMRETSRKVHPSYTDKIFS